MEEVPLKREGSSNPKLGSSTQEPRGPMLGTGVPMASDSEKSEDSQWDGRQLET